MTGLKLSEWKAEVRAEYSPEFFFTFPYFLQYPAHIQNWGGCSPLPMGVINKVKNKTVGDIFKSSFLSKGRSRIYL